MRKVVLDSNTGQLTTHTKFIPEKEERKVGDSEIFKWCSG
jgi:hypothetical protein